MNFTSIKEYFYKLYNICYVLVLAPLAVFLFLYYQLQVEKFSPIIKDQNTLHKVELGLFLLGAIILTTVHLHVRKRLVKVGKEVGLGDKMDHYFPLALLRTTMGAFVTFLMSIGFYLTGSIWCAVASGVTMLWIAWQWPSPKRFCNDLSVRNDERELMLKSKDSFKL